MKYLLVILSLLLISCEKSPYPDEVCPGGCMVQFTLPYDSLGQDGYWYVKYDGPQYFTIVGQLSKLDPYYVINKVPLVEVNFDSNYWVLLDTFQYQTRSYSYLGWYSNKEFTSPIPIGNITYTLQNIADIHPPLNIAGYQISKKMCMDCPYTPTLLGTRSKYTYEPRQSFFFDDQMIGDTALIFIKTIFNTDLGPREEVNSTIRVIFYE